MNRILKQAKDNSDILEYAQSRLEEHAASFGVFPNYFPREQRLLSEYCKLKSVFTGDDQLRELSKFDEVWQEYSKTREEIAYVVGYFDGQQVQKRLTKEPTD